MQFREALALVCAEPVAPGGEFFTHAKLCDLCANDFKSKAKVELFYRIDRELSVVYRIQNEGIYAARALSESYPKVKDIIDRRKFDAMIDVVTEIILGKTATGAREEKEPARKAVVHAKPKAAPAKNAPAPAKNAPPPAANPVNPPAQNQAVSPASSGGISTPVYGDSVNWVIYGIVFCACMVGLFFLYRYVAGGYLATWAKWLIGAGTVLTITIVLAYAGLGSDGLTPPQAFGFLLPDGGG